MASFSLCDTTTSGSAHSSELGFGQRGGFQLGRCLAGLLLSDNAVMGTGYKCLLRSLFHTAFSFFILPQPVGVF
jgi:hypothetical protein